MSCAESDPFCTDAANIALTLSVVLGGRVLFAEWDNFRAPQACFEGVQVETVMSEIDIFVPPTGIITLNHMKKLKYNTYDGNTGHFDNEVDLACSEGLDGTEIDHIKP